MSYDAKTLPDVPDTADACAPEPTAKVGGWDCIEDTSPDTTIGYPWPIPTPPAPDPECLQGFIAWYRTATAATPSEQDRIEVFDSDGASLSAYAAYSVVSSADHSRLVSKNDTIVAIAHGPTTSEWGAICTVGGVEKWEYSRATSDLGGSEELRDAVILTNGDVLVLVFDYSGATTKQARLVRIDVDGDATTVATWTSSDIAVLGVTSGAWGIPEGLSLSVDESTIVLSFYASSTTVERNALVGVDASTGAVLWEVTPSEVTLEDGHLGLTTVCRVPESDAVLLTAEAWDGSVRVGRYDFPSGVQSAPTNTWAVEAHAAGQPVGLAANSTHAIVAMFTWGEDDIVRALRLSDGAVTWTYSPGDDVYPPWNGVAATDDLVLLSSRDDGVLFPTEWAGLVLLSAADGTVATTGVFPLEAWGVGPVAAACVKEPVLLPV